MRRARILAASGLIAALVACSSDGIRGVVKDNRAPTVWLAAAPPEGSLSKYRVHLLWGGWDPDGEIRGYEYLISDNDGWFTPADTVGIPWAPVSGNESTFTFSADEPVDTLHADNTRQVATFTRSHTFFIRSIDREGLRSKSVHRSFTAFTLSPEVRVRVPVKNQLNPADVPPISTFRWEAFDWIADGPPAGISQPPDSVQWVLKSTKDFNGDFRKTIDYLRDYRKSARDWYPWHWYRAPGDSGKFWTSPVVDLGTYIFAIRAKDEAGAVTPVLDEENNIRRIRVKERTSGPLMSVNNEYMGLIRTTSCATPLTIMDTPAGVALAFRVTADASSYGGEEAGYRYGWDIPDLNDPEQWEVDLTSFPIEDNQAVIPARTFYFGTHTLVIEVVDNSGYCSRVTIKVNIIPFTLERSLLVVDDDFADDASIGWATGVPTDAEHDAFWLDMVDEVAGFDPQIDLVDTRVGYLPITTLAKYKSIVWSVYSDRAMPGPKELLYKFIQYRAKNRPITGRSGGSKVEPNVLALAMAAGSHVMIAGRHPVQLVINRDYTGGLRFPVIWLYELEGQQAVQPAGNTSPLGDLSFAYRELCLETMDYAIIGTSTIARRSSGARREYCPTSTVRAVGGLGASDRGDGMREAFPLAPGWPTLTLRPEAAGPGGWYQESERGPDCEVYNPFYFQRGSGMAGECVHAAPPRSCFQPIYGLGNLDSLEPVYHQPIAFWTSAYADRVGQAPGAVAARSVVFGFQPVLINPAEFQLVMDRILFDEWKLPQGSRRAAAAAGTADRALPR